MQITKMENLVYVGDDKYLKGLGEHQIFRVTEYASLLGNMQLNQYIIKPYIENLGFINFMTFCISQEELITQFKVLENGILKNIEVDMNPPLVDEEMDNIIDVIYKKMQ